MPVSPCRNCLRSHFVRLLIVKGCNEQSLKIWPSVNDAAEILCKWSNSFKIAYFCQEENLCFSLNSLFLGRFMAYANGGNQITHQTFPKGDSKFKNFEYVWYYLSCQDARIGSRKIVPYSAWHSFFLWTFLLRMNWKCSPKSGHAWKVCAK